MEYSCQIGTVNGLQLLVIRIAVREGGMTLEFVYMSLSVPDAANPDDGGETGRELMSAEGGACIHRGNNLYPFKPHPLQIVVIETMIGQHLPTMNIVINN